MAEIVALEIVDVVVTPKSVEISRVVALELESIDHMRLGTVFVLLRIVILLLFIGDREEKPFSLWRPRVVVDVSLDLREWLGVAAAEVEGPHASRRIILADAP